MIRLIATDLDGTLLNENSSLTDRTLRALKRAMDAGIRISLSSGRMTEAMTSFAGAIGVNAPMILFNGALIYDPVTGETLYSRAIPLELARRVAQAIEEMGIYLQVYPGRGYFCCRRTAETEAYERSIRVCCTETGRLLSGWLQSDVVKMLAIAPPERIDRAQRELIRRFPNGVTFMKSRDNFLEIVAEGINKGAALRALAEHLAIPMEDVMAFGDGQNDAAMLEAAGTGVAMANAVDECRAVAQMMAPDNREDGVAQVIERMLDGAMPMQGGSGW